MTPISFDVVTVTLNPAIDLTVAIDDFATGKVNRVSSSRSSAGGKGVNVAASLADDGRIVAVAGLLGAENSEVFETLFVKKGIADHFTRVAGPTRFGLKITDAVSGETTDINFPGSTSTATEMFALRQKLEALDGGWFVLAGSLPPGFPDSFYADLILSLKARGKRVFLDASGEALRLAIAAKPDVIKPNLHELEGLLGVTLSSQEEVLKAARSLVAGGIETVVVSMGEQGAFFVSASEIVLAVPPKIKVSSTVGAGDAMVAGLISARLSNHSLLNSARIATAFSMDALTHPGAGVSSPQIVRQFTSEIALKSFPLE